MNKLPQVLISMLFLLLFLNCKKETISPKNNYSQKANQVIQQVILDDKCNCIMEIPNESEIEISLAENPSFNIRKKIIKELHIENRTELDSLEKLTNSFILDSSFLKQRNIKVIKPEFLNEIIKDTLSFRTCRKGILSISKPIFDNKYTTAIIYYGHALTCIGSRPIVYSYQKGKWSTK
jgi:hypothetical protein